MIVDDALKERRVSKNSAQEAANIRVFDKRDGPRLDGGILDPGSRCGYILDFTERALGVIRLWRSPGLFAQGRARHFDPPTRLCARLSYSLTAHPLSPRYRGRKSTRLNSSH